MKEKEHSQVLNDKKWNEDFPIDTISEQQIVRRDFLRFLTLVSGSMAIGTGAILAKATGEAAEAIKNKITNYQAVDICKEESLRPGEWLVFYFPDEKNPAILIRKENGDLLAYSQKCPHLACPVAYHRAAENEKEHIGCHCHSGKFDLATGKGIEGPPRELRPLKAIEVKVVDGRIVAMGYKEVA